MGVKLLFVVLIVNINLVWSGKHDIYEGCSVHGVVLNNDEELNILKELELKLNLDVWQRGLPAVRDAVVMVTPENKPEFFSTLESHSIQYYVQLDDVVQALENHEADVINYKMRRSNGAMPFNDYPRYAEINAYMERIAREYPDIATIVTAGDSFEGRPIKYLKISTTNFADTTKPIYFMDAALHAREWVTTPVTLYSIHKLVEDLASDERDLLDVDWIILPLANPDGYEYSHTNERLWRRTRSYRPEINATCYGVDGNRNFDVNFNTVGVSPDPCSNTYPGPYAFSEPETRIIRDILLEHSGRIQIYMNIHSYGNYVLYGYGNATLPSNAMELHYVGAAMGAAMDALKLSKADYYKVGNSNLVLYQSSGSAQDYGQVRIGVPFSYTLELPGYSYLFQVPPDYIEQINKETWAGIVETARLAKLFYTGGL
ncbi:carboxypeptidase B-like [Colias croceus]|uniref:carboxypeptidase B-like n=1 Tax=Colias crocea TaxID=72248 RepID=UPI001E28116B|nr:carboxypeptidase B-like [Colias croceus]